VGASLIQGALCCHVVPKADEPVSHPVGHGSAGAVTMVMISVGVQAAGADMEASLLF
jgi:hypothetical protein